MLNKIPRTIIIKLIIVFLLAIASSIFFWRYINSYLSRSKADSTAITLSLTPATLSLNLAETKETQLIMQFTGGSASEKIDGLKIIINFPKENIELADYVDTTASGLGTQIRVDGPVAANSSGQIIIKIGATAPGAGPATNSGPVTIAKIKFKGKLAVSNAAITIGDNLEIVNNASAAITQITKNNAIVNVGGAGAPTAPPASPTPPPGATATPTPPPGNVTLNLKLKFQGILKKPTTTTMSVRIKLGGSQSTDYQTAMFTADDNGVWSGMVGFNTTPGSGFIVYVKGPKHIQKKICAITPTETSPGTYHCGQGAITLANGANTLDFSGVLQLGGDLPDQDSVVNSYDISLVRNNLNKTDADAVRLTDLNLDGKVDTQDYSLVIAALSVRADEE